MSHSRGALQCCSASCDKAYKRGTKRVLPLFTLRTLQKTMCRQPLTPEGPADHKSALSCPSRFPRPALYVATVAGAPASWVSINSTYPAPNKESGS
jgi:hypothetical protein